ncbi:hypothetical protein HNQ50_002759 [Silvimonas terrae]|uniref:Autotransporter domain-containing protein n=1 Tax=Silvimonas terrae TaxID=300266 RepID=A0A840RIE6_9NEIS|nr:hypothetical protein [Silvimonas terrae]MBB5192022.1 hypothetical protein [Silvimonas terrae]
MVNPLRRLGSVAAMLAVIWPGYAGAAGTLDLPGADVQKRANAVLGLMGYSLVPDVTTSALSINSASSGDPGLTMSNLGGGATMSKDIPVYLEGTLAYSRYDPAFVATDGTVQRPIPFKWNSLAGTAGIGWDFPLAEHLVFRPIFNFALGTVASDLVGAKWFAEYKTGRQFDFLDNGSLNAYGLGGSLMLDYEDYQPARDIDVELRYTDITLHSFGGTSDAVQGSSRPQTLGLWARWRAPTGMEALGRPIRYVLEYAQTQYIGQLRGALGFNYLNSVGTGLELDTSKYDIFITRVRLVGRYMWGGNAHGASLGFAVSF